MNNYESHVKELFLLSSRIDAIYHKQAAAFGISNTESLLLYIIGENLASTQKDILELWGVSKTTLNSAVMRLERSGILEFGEKKGKEKTLVLTEKGKCFASRINAQSNIAESRALIETEKLAKAMGTSLNDLITIFKQYTESVVKELGKELEHLNG